MSIESLAGAQSGVQPTLQQCASAVLMIRPAAFDYNPQTAASNRMQKAPIPGGVLAGSIAGAADVALGLAPAIAVAAEPPSAQTQALVEFDNFTRALQSEGISVCVVDDTPTPPKPDALFPNNWVSFHEDGTVVLYPLEAENRRTERRTDILDKVTERLGFKVTRIVDLTRHEARGRFLEGTGSLVLDHCNRMAYACRSSRTDPEIVEEWAHELGYQPVVFDAFDRDGVPFYHTNVMMCLGTRMAVLGGCAMTEYDRNRVIEKLEISGRDIIAIDQDEIRHFGGNMLELASWDEALGDYRLLVMSEAARQAFRPDVYARLAAGTDSVLAIPTPTIETLGGGSVRCMMAEVFLPT
jgi:hypothetical protein